MTSWQIGLTLAAGVAGVAALYGSHRLCLWLEERGQLYYLKKKPGSAPSFTALQEIVEPSARHVHHVRDEKRARADGDGAPPEA